ncbi:MAG: alpha/beta hydrolase [Acetobacteraceae bacterium]|nr:alpha/beta hydrolase [Acetobacteraceae bacterium]
MSRIDPEMQAARLQVEAEAAKFPPVVPKMPIDPQRVVNDHLSGLFGAGGPVMAHSQDRFVSANGRRVMCRLHKPVAGHNMPVLVWLHGGGWVWASIDTHDRLVRELAHAGGVATISVDYSLSPEARFPQAVVECAEVIRKIAADAATWGIDPARIIIGGDSAGGNLALATAIMLRDDFPGSGGGPKLAGILAAYPVTDTDFDSPTYREFADGYGLTRAAMMTYWDLYLRDPIDRLNPLAAPMRDSLKGLPPTMVLLAEIDVLRSEGERLAAKMVVAGVKVTLESFAGMVHGFLRFSEVVGKSRVAIAEAGKWLRKAAVSAG